MKKIAVLGYGVVGSGVVELFYRNQKKIEKNVGDAAEVGYILDLREFPDDPYGDRVVHDIQVILDDPEVGYVAECMGGVTPAFDFVRRCLEAGKSVSTSNKQLVAEKGDILLQVAKEHHVNFFFEASVGGAIPIIRPLHTCLAANDISAVAGILNGTTNFILEKMICENMRFDDALALAQKLGYAERDPSADVDGGDACRKICILSSLVFGRHVYPDQVYTKGIRNITLEDVQLAQQFGGAVKLIGAVKRLEDGRILPTVMPMLVMNDSLISHVNGVFNAVMVWGDGVDKTMFYGRGAGELPTASAVVGDVFDIVRNILNGCCGRIGCTCYKNLPIKHMNEISSKFFIRMFVEDRPGVLANIASVFGNSGVSLAQVIQRRKNDQYAEIVVITDDVKEKNLKDALAVAKGMSTVKEISGMIRVA